MPKAAAVHSGLQSDVNPFSPTKKRPVASSSKQRLLDGSGETPIEESRPDGGVAAVSHALSVLDTQDSVDETQAFAVARKARKRLRGDPVSPSPNRPEKKVRKNSDFGSPTAPPSRPRNANNDIDKSDDAEMSFFGESPVKQTFGKDFKSLFDEAEKPMPRLLFPSAPESKPTGSAASLNSAGKTPNNRQLKFDPKGVQKSQSRLNSLGVLNGSSRRTFENTLNASNGKQDSDKPAAAQDVSSQKRPASMDGENDDGAQQNLVRENTLLPPSPTQSSQSVPKSSKGFSNRKKAKTKAIAADTDDSEGEDVNALHVIDLEMKDLRHRGQQEDLHDSDMDDDLLVSMRRTEVRGNSSQPSDEEVDVDVDIPQDMREFLDISSSRARERDEGEVVDSLLQGRRRYAKGEVWGVGEMESEDEGGAHTEGDDDWLGEGLPWEAAELSDFEGNV